MDETLEKLAKLVETYGRITIIHEAGETRVGLPTMRNNLFDWKWARSSDTKTILREILRET